MLCPLSDNEITFTYTNHILKATIQYTTIYIKSTLPIVNPNSSIKAKNIFPDIVDIDVGYGFTLKSVKAPTSGFLCRRLWLRTLTEENQHHNCAQYVKQLYDPSCLFVGALRPDKI